MIPTNFEKTVESDRCKLMLAKLRREELDEAERAYDDIIAGLEEQTVKLSTSVGGAFSWDENCDPDYKIENISLSTSDDVPELLE